jgi:thiamine biosynthesis lipoprotein
MSLAQYAAVRWQALGTYIGLVTADSDRLAAAKAGSERLLEAIDRACSRFRPDSDLVRANRAAGNWVRVDPLLSQAVAVAIQAAEATAGLVDPTLGGQLVALGYDRDLKEVRAAEPEAAEYASDRLVSTSPGLPALAQGWRAIGIDPTGGLRVPKGVSLDLGATGKAFAADLIAATVPALTGTSLVISLGGDVAIGQFDADVHPWRIAVAERPEQADGPEAEIVVLEEGALATSSVLARRWRHGGGIVHHLLDPSTGLPVRPYWSTASVCAGSCAEANAASTAAIVMGERAGEWLEQQDFAARLVDLEGRVSYRGGWPVPVP